MKAILLQLNALGYKPYLIIKSRRPLYWKIKMHSHTQLNVLVALHCEAKAIIKHLKLKKIVDRNLPFPIFVNSEENIHLIIGGVGKVRMAAATAFLYSFTGSKPFACFLNVGIAGSTQFKLGALVLAHKIKEKSTNRCWFPFITPFKNKNQTELMTFDMPQTDYPNLGMIDMEGSAFFATSTLFVSQEHVQVVKIISDQDELTQQQIDGKKVQELISAQLVEIDEIIRVLINISNEEYLIQREPNQFEKMKLHWHFTHAQSLQLRELLRRWEICFKREDPWSVCQNEVNSTQVLKQLMNKLMVYENSLC